VFESIRAIAFDLDGTLVDTSEVVLEAFRIVFRQLQEDGVVKQIPSDETFLGTFGTIDDQIWKNLLPDISEDVRTKAMSIHDDLVNAGLRRGNLLIPGAIDVLKDLHDKYVLATASNCGTDYLDGILQHQKIESYFSHCMCAGTIQAKEKAEVLEEIMNRLGHRDLLMVGDRKSDIDAARKAGIPVVGVRYKFAKEGELDRADVVIHSISELPGLLT
jgi:phosphoglycolate phosphatase